LGYNTCTHRSVTKKLFIAFLNKQKCHFFSFKNWRTGGHNRCCLGELVTMGVQRMWGKGVRE
jgi:hypothetical protein